MSTSLNLLLLEDSPADAELMIEALRESGFDLSFRRVESKDAYLRELDQPPDFILSDYSMPQFTARDALRLMKERIGPPVHYRLRLYRRGNGRGMHESRCR